MSDLISRQAAIDAIKRCESADSYDLNNGLIISMNAVADIPTIEPKRGKWINDKGLYRCSVCNNLWTSWWAVVVPEESMCKEMKYCPNCGAKMERGEE